MKNEIWQLSLILYEKNPKTIAKNMNKQTTTTEYESFDSATIMIILGQKTRTEHHCYQQNITVR